MQRMCAANVMGGSDKKARWEMGKDKERGAGSRASGNAVVIRIGGSYHHNAGDGILTEGNAFSANYDVAASNNGLSGIASVDDSTTIIEGGNFTRNGKLVDDEDKRD